MNKVRKPTGLNLCKSDGVLCMFCRFENVLMPVENISCFVEEVPQNYDPSEEYFLGAMTLLSNIAYKLCPAEKESGYEVMPSMITRGSTG